MFAGRLLWLSLSHGWVSRLMPHRQALPQSGSAILTNPLSVRGADEGVGAFGVRAGRNILMIRFRVLRPMESRNEVVMGSARDIQLHDMWIVGVNRWNQSKPPIYD